MSLLVMLKILYDKNKVKKWCIKRFENGLSVLRL